MIQNYIYLYNIAFKNLSGLNYNKKFKKKVIVKKDIISIRQLFVDEINLNNISIY